MHYKLMCFKCFLWAFSDVETAFAAWCCVQWTKIRSVRRSSAQFTSLPSSSSECLSMSRVGEFPSCECFSSLNFTSFSYKSFREWPMNSHKISQEFSTTVFLKSAFPERPPRVSYKSSTRESNKRVAQESEMTVFHERVSQDCPPRASSTQDGEREKHKHTHTQRIAGISCSISCSISA